MTDLKEAVAREIYPEPDPNCLCCEGGARLPKRLHETQNKANGGAPIYVCAECQGGKAILSPKAGDDVVERAEKLIEAADPNFYFVHDSEIRAILRLLNDASLLRQPKAEKDASFIDVVFDGPPSHESGRFVEVENAKGESINAGEWIDRGNGLWALRLPAPAPEAAPGWQPIETAPKDKPILAFCNHEADPYHESDKRLTLYGAHCEGMGFAETGIHIIEWGGGFDDRSYEEPNGSHLPDWWFVVGWEFEKAANPTHWMPLPPAPSAPSVEQDKEKQS